MTRRLIVNADDFGQSEGINLGVARAHEHGIVTSASLMVRWPAAEAAAAYARKRRDLSVGLHLDLGEWVPRGEEWVPLYEVRGDPARALSDQLARFRELMGRDPTHLDSHQHVHRSEPVLSAMLAAARRLRVPLRSFSPDIRYCGDFYAQASRGVPHPTGISRAHLLTIIDDLPEGTTELSCHPAAAADMQSAYTTERLLELEVLCDSIVKAAIDRSGIALARF